MKPHKAIAFLLVFPAVLLVQAKDKKSSNVPAVFGQARYVYVEAVDGQEFDPNLYPEDREAIADVRDALTGWKRYTLTTERDQADLIFVVRKGRAARADAGMSRNGGPDPVGVGQPRSGVPMGGTAAQMGGEMGPLDDFFEVCQGNADGKRGTPLWERSMPDGLSAPRVLLFQQFKEAVDKAYPLQPTGQAQKP